MEALARGCPKLKRFSSKGCRQINDDAVVCLSNYCKGIEVLNLHSCDVRLIYNKRFLFFLCNFVFLDNYRLFDTKDRRTLPATAPAVRFQVSGADRSHTDLDGAAQSLSEHDRGGRLPSVYRFGISGPGKGICLHTN